MRFIATLTALGFTALSSSGGATTLLQMDFDEIVRQADGVLAGTVTDITSRKSEDGIIYSFVTLGDLDVLGGGYGEESFTLRIEGGEVDGEIQEVEGAPDFRRGERVVVFVEGNGERIVPIAGWEQGLFRVVTDPETGTSFVVDAVGNRIFGIRDGELIKENKFGSRAELFGQGTGAYVGSEPPQIDFGRAEGGHEVEPDEDVAGEPPSVDMQGIVGEPLTLQQFEQQIDSRIGAAEAGETRSLDSVEPGALPEARFEDAAPSQEPEGGETPELAPADRAEVPRKIEEGPRPDMDEQQ